LFTSQQIVLNHALKDNILIVSPICVNLVIHSVLNALDPLILNVLDVIMALSFTNLAYVGLVLKDSGETHLSTNADLVNLLVNNV
jgi:hypothetical protein